MGAISGFCNMLWKVLEDLKAGDQPTHFACIFDAGAITFRNELYDQYKAHRPDPPEDLIPQFPLVRRAAIAFGQPALEMKGFEADDLIATYSRQAAAKGARVSIVSADKDLMQLVNDQICMLDTVKDRKICAPEVFEKFGVTPDKVIDVQALCGDSVDNVPGVPGIGIKTAALLIQEYGDLETLLARAGEIKQPKRRESLIEHADKARLSKVLVTLKDDVPIEVPLEELGVSDPDPAPLLAFLQEMEFRTLTTRVAQTLGAEAPGAASHPPPADRRWPMRLPPRRQWRRKADGDGGRQRCARRELRARRARSSALRSRRLRDGDRARPSRRLDRAKRKAQGFVAVDTETDGLDPMSAQLVGVSLALAPGKACYIPLGHGADKTDLLSEESPSRSRWRRPSSMLKPLLEDPVGPQDRAEHQVRHLDLPRPRHRRRADRRHHAAVLRARSGPAQSRHGRAVRASPWPHADPDQGADRHGQVADHLRPDADRQGDALCRRRRRRHAAPVGAAEAAPVARGRSDGLRDDGSRR